MRIPPYPLLLLLLTPFLSSLPLAMGVETHGEEESKEMGPVGFMWPPDREWGAAQDNTPPCGSKEGVTERTDFPMLNGAIALVIQDDSWDVQVSISYKDEPKSNSDFTPLIPRTSIRTIEPGHACYPLPPPERDIEDGTNATIQLRYRSEFDSDETETFYACADITYVATSKFDAQIPCFNVTTEEFSAPESDNSGGENSKSDKESESDSVSDYDDVGNEGSGGLSGGEIAGVVVGSVAGVGLLAAAYAWYRKYQQKKRIRLHEMSARSVKWEGVTTA